MQAQGQAATDLDTFDKSEKMMEIRSFLRISANEGNSSSVISFENLGNSREAIFIITLLRNHGYTVNYGKKDDGVIIVKW
ncbi:hypothetical protein [Planococcus beigongshangi]|uniref:hypothetical protein n=1 Tax=Planococcus beigongshangi TaxID=2782536 RepID=UPI00193B76B7|nr:hypothetical protein [Planococcus beigongshangi]